MRWLTVPAVRTTLGKEAHNTPTRLGTLQYFTVQLCLRLCLIAENDTISLMQTATGAHQRLPVVWPQVCSFREQ